MLRSIGGAFVQKAVEVNFAVHDHLAHAHQTVTKIVDEAIHAPKKYCIICNRSCIFHRFTYLGPKQHEESTDAQSIDSPENEENITEHSTQISVEATTKNDETEIVQTETTPIDLPSIEQLSNHSEIHVCPSCYFDGKIPIGSYHDEYEEYGKASSVRVIEQFIL